MPSVEIEGDLANKGNGEQQSATLSGPVIGIIYPPPEVRSILLQTKRKIENMKPFIW